ncbi:putative GPCR GprK-type [Stachybotrys elegans]|uniref:GPCR GprK-type n=1 Tax=Stachybotrys elegans TaxID=80388 RepID=A0A8K0WV32_9HYPO|nr:putative GPCR GprK-type [Stachybotrys elegans]
MAEEEAPHIILDGVGIFWMIWGGVWTIALITGMTYLWTNRHMPLLRIRGLPLSFAAVILLHMYWTGVQYGYVYGPLMSAGVEYWIMNIWLPFGIALFHASNSRFLYIAKAQKKFVSEKLEVDRASIRPRPKTLVGKFRQMDHTSRVLLLVCTGMAFQLMLAVFMFLVSRKFHPSFGIPGTEVHGTPSEQRAAAGRGWEWWPSVFWQFFWAWLVAPFILWKARKLNDTQGWRTQTIGCCLSSLHATPLWLIGIYVPAMAPVNRWWIPPQWIALSVWLIEIFTIFLPCWEVMKHQALCEETRASLARWETNNRMGEMSGVKSIMSTSTGGSWVSRMTQTASISTSSGGSVLTMDALELTLSRNPAPLQHFSALRDFSGENIAFLMRVREWRMTYFAEQKKGKREPSSKPISPECFESALHIYHDFISAKTAELQVNLASTDFKKLENVFEPVAGVLYSDEACINPIAPFDGPYRATKSSHSHESQTAINQEHDVTELPDISLGNTVRVCEIPDGFDQSIFDDSEKSIKYLVLTNTWPKFIKERRSFES